MRTFKSMKEIRDLKVGDVFMHGGTMYTKTFDYEFMSDFERYDKTGSTHTMGNSNLVTKVIKRSL